MNNLTTDLEAVMQKIAGGGPHEWGYRDVTDGTFIEDDWPFDAQNFLRNYGDAIRELQGENERLREALGNIRSLALKSSDYRKSIGKTDGVLEHIYGFTRAALATINGDSEK